MFRSAYTLLASYLKRMPLNLYRTYSHPFKLMVQKKASDYDMIFVDHYEVFQYVSLDYKGRVILHEHNAYYIMWDRYARTAGNPWAKRFISYLEALRVKKAEANACRKADLIFCRAK